MEEWILTLKNWLLEEYAAISVAKLVVAVLAACLLGLLVALVYRMTYSGVLFSRSFAFGLVLLSMITSVIILAISSNLVLSLGMVGALSIVRFRTAIKEPLDTIFMFWALATGILTGAGFLLIAALATVLIGALFLVLNLCGGLITASSVYLLIVRYDAEAAERVRRAAAGLPGRIKSMNHEQDFDELIMELRLAKAQMKQVDAIKQIAGVTAVNLVASGGSALS